MALEVLRLRLHLRLRRLRFRHLCPRKEAAYKYRPPLNPMDGVSCKVSKMNGNICGERLPDNETCQATISCS